MGRVEKLMKDEASWVKLERRNQYIMLGFYHDTSKLLYTNDYTALKLCPMLKPKPDYLWEDIHLSKQNSCPNSTLKIQLPDDSSPPAQNFVVLQSRCAGVKVLFFLFDEKTISCQFDLFFIDNNKEFDSIF